MSAEERRDPRLEALRATRLLDSAPEETFDRLTRLATRLLGVPVALISLVDRDRQFFKSQHGLPEPWASARETPLTHSFCQHVTASGTPLVVRDSSTHALVAENLARRDLGVVAYLGVPLIAAEGFVLGSLCAIDSVVRDWGADDIATMRDLAAMTMTEINLRAEIRDRKEAQEGLALLADELQHRVKNAAAVAQAIAQLSIRAAEGLDGLAESVGRRLMALSRTNDLIYRGAQRDVGLRELLDRELSAFDSERRVALVGPEIAVDAQAGVALSMICHELATNAAKYGGLSVAGGRVAVTWSRQDERLAIEWRESGPGLVVAMPGRRGFGSLLIDRLARHQLGGNSRVEYRPDGLVATVDADYELVRARLP